MPRTNWLTDDDCAGRHIARHAKRDEEAGGPGLGVLETRKRTRRGPDGAIITRPTKKQARATAVRPATGPEPSTASSASGSSRCGLDSAQRQDSSISLTTPPSTSDLGYRDRDNAHPGAPVSPPRSTGESCASTNLENGQLDAGQTVDTTDPLIAPMVPGGPYEPYVEPIPGQFDAADGSWQGHSAGLDFGFGDFLDLDTGKVLLCGRLF